MRSEIDLMRQLLDTPCKNIVSYVDDYEDDSCISLFIEYFETNLQDVIQERKASGGHFSDQEICDILLHVAEGLQFFHNLPVPILHRDIKSDNVFINGKGRSRILKIGDLGECKPLPDSVNYISVAGTAGYMDASILQRHPVSVMADIFSLGMLMFELLSLERPYYDARDRFERNQRVIDGVLPVLPVTAMDIDKRDSELVRLYFSMIGKTSSRPSAGDIVTILGKLLLKF
mmetsp:Transcript_5744/g.16310  ORF Transcript_5744/g.16310 Transcript_5744/m.16310 type:complete len:231 (+) Transcript_5744:227-919(+)